MSSDDSDEPSLELLKSRHLQRKVDKRLRDLSQSSHSAGKLKYKSQRGGDIDVKVRHKVHWPHEVILGGFNRQRVGYDQLSLTQWIQGFCCNVLKEKSESRKDNDLVLRRLNGRHHRFLLAGGSRGPVM